MPYIMIDYDQQILDQKIDELVKGLLNEAKRIYNLGDDFVSVFTSEYGKHHFSTSAAEIEVRVGQSDYIHPGVDKDELRLEHIAEFKKYITNFIETHKMTKGIIFTITFQDWKAEFIAV